MATALAFICASPTGFSDADPAPVGLAVGGALVLAALLHISQIRLLQSFSTSLLICAAAIAPQAIFQKFFDWGFGHLDQDLPSWVARYEAALLYAHAWLSGLKLPALAASGLATGAFLTAALTGRALPGIALGSYQKWLGRALLVLFAATSFTFVSTKPAPSGASAGARVTAQIRAQAKAKAEMAMAEELARHAADAHFIMELEDTAKQLAQASGAVQGPKYVAIGSGVVRLSDAWVAVGAVTADAAGAAAVVAVDKVLGPQIPASARAVEPVSTATLTEVRAAYRNAVTLQSAADQARQRALEAISLHLPETGLPIADQLLDKLVDTFIDKASERLVDVGFDQARRRGGNLLLDRPLHAIVAEVVGGFLATHLTPIQRESLVKVELPARLEVARTERLSETTELKEGEKAKAREHDAREHAKVRGL